VRLTDILGVIDLLLQLPDDDVGLFVHDKSKSTLASSLLVLEKVAPLLARMDAWGNPALQDTLKGFAKDNGLKVGTVMWPVRIALSGRQVTPPARLKSPKSRAAKKRSGVFDWLQRDLSTPVRNDGGMVNDVTKARSPSLTGVGARSRCDCRGPFLTSSSPSGILCLS